MNRTCSRVIFASLVLPFAASASDTQKAFDFLEARQHQWADWKPAQRPGGACISCHSGLPYLIARRVLGEELPRPSENALMVGVRSRVLAKPPQATLQDEGAEAVLNLLTLSLRRRSPKDPIDEADRLALKRLWEKQIKTGTAKGSWSWVNADLDPMDAENSTYLGTALAELALSAYDTKSSEGERMASEYLKRTARNQPLHNRLAWIAFRSNLETRLKSAVLNDLWRVQSSDGGWSTAAIGPWIKHEDAPHDSGSNAYATAWATFTAQESGVACSDSRLKRAIDWLEGHQDPATGAWNAVSLNKVYAEGSMQAKFMTDAATGYATAALLRCQQTK
jgi:hypothetical protein